MLTKYHWNFYLVNFFNNIYSTDSGVKGERHFGCKRLQRYQQDWGNFILTLNAINSMLTIVFSILIIVYG